MLAEESPDCHQAITALYQAILDCWNRRDARAMAALFTEDGDVTGFDGSMLAGAAEIESSMAEIFGHHETPAYVGKPKTSRLLSDSVAILRAVAGMTPVGKVGLDPSLNAVQTLIAVKQNASWRAASFQSTPAAFHGRPEAADRLTHELEDFAAANGGLPSA